MLLLIKFTTSIINAFDFILSYLFKKDLRGLLYDNLQSRINIVDINNKKITFLLL